MLDSCSIRCSKDTFFSLFLLKTFSCLLVGTLWVFCTIWWSKMWKWHWWWKLPVAWCGLVEAATSSRSSFRVWTKAPGCLCHTICLTILLLKDQSNVSVLSFHYLTTNLRRFCYWRSSLGFLFLPPNIYWALKCFVWIRQVCRDPENITNGKQFSCFNITFTEV